MKFDSIRDAAYEWVKQFNAIPEGVIEKLMNHGEEVYEITPPSKCDRVYIYGDERKGQYGEIVDTKYDDEDDLYVIKLDDSGDEVIISSDDFEVERDGILPMWGTLWTFGDSIDEEWANGEYLGSHLQEMADCGFRMYEQEDFGLLFGIDGCGYDFYESHWIPLYKARGLHWHKEEEEDE